MNLRLCSAYSAAILTCFGAWAPRAAAQITVFDTLSAANDTVSVNVAPPGWLAQSFTTDATANQISSITVKFSSSGSVGNYFFSLRSNGANYPGTDLGTFGSGLNSTVFGGDSLSFSPSFFDIAFSSLSIPVTPNTRYWVVASTDGSGLRWGSHLGNLVAGESIATDRNPASTARNNLMSVVVTPVPEPSTEAAVAAGALLLLGVYRWASRRSV
jgi:hypothetical protein